MTSLAGIRRQSFGPFLGSASPFRSAQLTDKSLKIPGFGLSIIGIVAILLATAAAAEPPGQAKNPVGYNGMVVIVGDGEYDPTSPNPNPDITGCFSGLCDGDYFWNEIAKLPAEERAAQEQEAKDFFLQRFGLDADALVASGAAIFLDYYADPRFNYRARFITGETIHEYGWEAHDQAFGLITNAELVLGGDFAGQTIPAGTLIPKGQYWIEKSEVMGQGQNRQIVPLGQYLIIKWQAAGPVEPPGVNGLLASACEVTASPWGTGVAQIASSFAIVDDDDTGLAKQNVRNIITLDGDRGLGTYPGVYNE